MKIVRFSVVAIALCLVLLCFGVYQAVGGGTTITVTPGASGLTDAPTAAPSTEAPSESVIRIDTGFTLPPTEATEPPSTVVPVPTQPVTAPPTIPAPTDPITVPTEPSASTPPVVSDRLSLVSMSQSVSANSKATVRVRGIPGTSYSIAVYYSSGPSSAKGLTDKTASTDGIVEWTWRVGPKTKPGQYRIVISGGGETLELKFTVT